MTGLKDTSGIMEDRDFIASVCEVIRKRELTKGRRLILNLETSSHSSTVLD